MLQLLLDDIFREGESLSLRVKVYDDGTPQSHQVHDSRALFIRRTYNGGKTQFFQWINRILEDSRGDRWWGRLLLLPDDVRLVKNFFSELENAWIRIPRGNRGILLNPLVDNKRYNPHWTGIRSVYYSNADLYKVGWNDCCFYCDRRFPDKFNHVKRPVRSRWRRRYISSGVGEQVSKWGVRNRWTFWQVPESLLWSDPHPSQMHRKP